MIIIPTLIKIARNDANERARNIIYKGTTTKMKLAAESIVMILN